MPFGKEARPVRAYAFGLWREPLEGREAAIDSQRARTALWNALVALERTRRESVETLLAAHMPEGLEGAEAKAARRAAFKEPGIKERIAEGRSAIYQDAKPICRAVGCYTWQEDDVLTSWRTACRGLDPPRFHGFRPYEGVCALRWQTGLPVAEALAGTDLRLQLLPWSGPEEERRAFLPDPHSKRSQRREWRLCRFRVGSADRKPVWLIIPVCLHRPLPPEGLIRKAHLKWERVGSRVRWSLSLVVESAEAAPGTPQGTARAGIDLGWRRVKRGLRVAFLRDDRGHAEEVILPNAWLERWEHVEKIGQMRDLQFNEEVKRLADWKREQGEPLPEWFREETAHLGQWRKPSRLARLMLRWRENRFAGDEALFDHLEAWRRHDKHHWSHEANLRDQLLADRRHRYREFAAWAARTYREIVLERFDLRKVARVKKDAEGEAGAGKDLAAEARHQRQMAAPSTFRLALLNACKREGVTVLTVSAKDTTMRCSRCGYRENAAEFDKAAELVHQCPNCGVTMDQDQRAAENLLNYEEKGDDDSAKEDMAA